MLHGYWHFVIAKPQLDHHIPKHRKMVGGCIQYLPAWLHQRGRSCSNSEATVDSKLNACDASTLERDFIFPLAVA